MVVFSPRCGASSRAGSSVGHGPDCSHPDGGLHLALEEQVCSPLTVIDKGLNSLVKASAVPIVSVFLPPQEEELRGNI